MNIHEEINQNMTVSAGGGFELNNDELESLKNNQVWSNSRANRRKAVVDKGAPRNISAHHRINGAALTESSASNVVIAQQLPVEENRDVIQTHNVNNRKSSDNTEVIQTQNQNNKNTSENMDVIQTRNLNNKNTSENMNVIQTRNLNNKNSSEDLETLRENIRNSKELEKKGSSSENILEIEESMRRNSLNSGTNRMRPSTCISSRGNPSTLSLSSSKANFDTQDGANSENQSSEAFQSPTSPTAKDPHTAYIDLSNNCRQFYFSHMKTAEAIKKSVRGTRHSRALDKVNGKPRSGIDHAMDRLRAEMADLMEQDLSLMSQLLTLNDQIEEIKTHVRNSVESQSQSYFSMSDVTDNEYSDLEESGIFNRDFSMRRDSVTLNSSTGLTRTNQLPETTPERAPVIADAKPRKIEPSEREIIVYRKKKSRRKTNSGKTRSRSNSSTEDEDSEATDEESGATTDDDDADGNSDTDSTISCNSSTGSTSELTETDTTETAEPPDSGIQSPTSEAKKPEDAKPVKGGVSRNRFFLKFHKKNGVSDATSGTKSVLTLQGHHIPLEKYYIPQGLVYLKHTESDNVFCQFSH